MPNIAPDAQRRLGDDGSVSTAGVTDERAFAEEVAGPERGDRPAAVDDGRRAVEDDEERIARRPLRREVVARLGLPLLEPPRHPLHGLVGEIGEERDAAQLFNGGRHGDARYPVRSLAGSVSTRSSPNVHERVPRSSLSPATRVRCRSARSRRPSRAMAVRRPSRLHRRSSRRSSAPPDGALGRTAARHRPLPANAPLRTR